MSTQWKQVERDVAKFFGGIRVGGMGDNLKKGISLASIKY